MTIFRPTFAMSRFWGTYRSVANCKALIFTLARPPQMGNLKKIPRTLSDPKNHESILSLFYLSPYLPTLALGRESGAMD